MRLPQLTALLRSLDPEQARVAAWTPDMPHHRIVAGAGSGKSRTAVALAGRLIADEQVLPSKLVLSTFSRKAGNVLRQRLSPVLPATAYRAIRVGTFHSQAYKRLRDIDSAQWSMSRCLDAAGRKRAAGIPSATVLWRCAVEYGVMPGTAAKSLKIGDDNAKTYMHAVDLLRAFGVDSPTDSRFVAPERIEERLAWIGQLPKLAEAWQLVLDAKEAINAWDWADALTAYLQLVRAAPGDHVVIVDEAQDQSWIQLQIVQEMARDTGRILLFADGRQTVYSWRGAYPELFLTADKVLGARTLQLRTNYRSLPSVVELGNRVAHGKSWSVGDPSVAHRTGFEPVAVESWEEPPSVVALKIALAVKLGASYGDFAIIARTNACIGAYQGALTEAQIPCALLGGQSLFSHREVEVFLCYCILTKFDAYNSLERVLNYPKRYLGQKFMAAVRAERHEARDMLDAIGRAGNKLGGFTRRNASKLLDDLRRLRRTPWRAVPDAVMKLVVPKTIEEPSEGDSPDENRPELYAATATIARRFDDPLALHSFAERCAANAVTVNEGDDVPNNRVVLTTFHGCKGMEWKHVYADATNGRFPTKHVTPQTMPEEERLFYVASTRAQDKLTWVFEAKRGPSPLLRAFLPAETQAAARDVAPATVAVARKRR